MISVLLITRTFVLQNNITKIWNRVAAQEKGVWIDLQTVAKANPNQKLFSCSE